MSIIPFQTSTVQRSPLGLEHKEGAGFGRVYRYAKNGPQALAAGVFAQGPINELGHANLAVAVAKSPTASTISVTVKQAKVDTDDYKDGFLYINDVDGQGYVYDVISNLSVGASEAGTACAVTIDSELVVALTTSSEATLIKNPYKGVTLPLLKAFAPIAGVTPVAVAANSYFWLQVRGPAAVLQEGTLYVGKPVALSNKTRGAVTLAKQVIPVPSNTYGEVGGDGLTEAFDFTQDALKTRIRAAAVTTSPTEVLTEISGAATLPEVILGYCLDPRADTEYALIDLRIA